MHAGFWCVSRAAISDSQSETQVSVSSSQTFALPLRRGSKNSENSESRDSNGSGISNQDHSFTQRLGQDVSSGFLLSSNTKMVVHAARCVFLSALREEDQRVKASGRKLGKCHSGEDSACSECVLRSNEESGETRKESITS